MTQKIQTGLLYGAVVVAILAFMYLLGSQIPRSLAGAPTGLPTTVSVATTTAVGPQQNIQLFSASSCNSRIVSTVASAVMLTFEDPSNGDVSSTTLSGVKGHLQTASTTVAYDSGLYGCGRVFAYAFASSTITTTETR